MCMVTGHPGPEMPRKDTAATKKKKAELRIVGREMKRLGKRQEVLERRYALLNAEITFASDGSAVNLLKEGKQ